MKTDEEIIQAVQERIGDYTYRLDSKHIKCQAMKIAFDHMEHAYGRSKVWKAIRLLNRITGSDMFNVKYFYDEMNWISYEVYHTVWETAKLVTGDEDFCYNAGSDYFRFNKGGLITVGKYLGSPEKVYRKIPFFVNKFNNQVNIEVLEVFPDKATIRMTLKKEFRDRFADKKYIVKNGCDLVKGVMQQIPTVFDFPKAEVVDMKCVGEDDEHCEWKFVWKTAPFFVRYWNSLMARDYKKLMDEQNRELASAIAVLETKYEELEQKNKELMKVQQELIEKEKLESAVRLLSELTHDLKTPLTMISGYAQLLGSGDVEKEEIAEYTNQIKSQSTRTVRIVQDLLNHLRGRPPVLDFRKTDIVEFILRLYSEIKADFESAGIQTFLVSLEKGKCSCSIDPEALKRAIYNICRNSKEAMPDGGKFYISLGPEPGRVCLEFRDTGAGISEETREMLFKKMTSTKKDGCGLGLGIAKSIIEAHKGSIDIESSKDIGTTVIVRLPKSSAQ